METTDKELALTSAEINEMLNELAAEQKELSRLHSELQEKNAAAPAPVVPTPLGSQRPIPEAILSLVVSPKDFNPLSFFSDFVELMSLVHSGELSYSDITTRIYGIEGDIPDLTVHQIVSAIYDAANKEQSK